MRSRGTRKNPPKHRWQAWLTLVMRSPRTVLLGLVVIGIFAGFTLRLWNLQFVQGGYYQGRAERQSTEVVTVPAPRGLIYDRAGAPLVRNVPSFNVTVVPGYLPEDEAEAEAILIRLAMLLDMPYTTAGMEEEDVQPGLRELLDTVGFAGVYQPLAVRKNVSRDVALLVAQEATLMPGVSVEVSRVREYPAGPLVSQILGYMSPIPEGFEEDYRAEGYDPSVDRIGVAGIEATYEDVLRGQKGQRIVEEDVLGREVRVVDEPAVAVPGRNVHLTLDLELQAFVEETLRAGMARPNVNSPRGVAIVMNPQTGEVLAMVSLPTYDNNLFAKGISAREWRRLGEDPHTPLLNHAISDGLPPGSVFKVVVASGALQEEAIVRDTRFLCEGTMVVPNKFYPNDPGQAQPFYCWNRSGHGWLDVVGGVAHSCDIFFYKTGGGFEEEDFDGLGVSGVAEYARLFGMGEPTGIELPAEIAGLVPTADWKRLTFGESWSTGDTYNLSIGQGFLLVTPLQMLNAVNAVANGGTLYRPTIVHHVTDPEGNVVEPFAPDIQRALPVDEEHIATVQEGMEGAVAYGTAPNAQLEGIRVGGKTGTAQFCDNIAQELGICGVGLDMPEHAWFAAYAPVEDPEVSVIVFVYNGGEGSVTSVPVAHDILEHYFGLDQTEADSDEPASP